MSSALNIQLGRFAIARWTIAKDKLEEIIRGWMETAGIETAIEVSIEEHADLWRLERRWLDDLGDCPYPLGRTHPNPEADASWE